MKIRRLKRITGMTAGHMVLHLTRLASQISADAYRMSQREDFNGVGKKEAARMFESIRYWVDEFETTYERCKDQTNKEEAS